ncbi:MAG: citrate synthase family protein [Alphaproteobacteria bacterium]|nr:citrate synthase family protein [Alphaproteobacteria bacterium]
MSDEFVSAREAAALLGIRPASLYAYASRGLLRPEAGAGRESRYRLAELEAFRQRRAAARSPRRAARGSLDFGLPVLESRITLIEGGRLYYRGRDAAALAESAGLGEVAALLWDVPPALLAIPDEKLPPCPVSPGFLARAAILLAESEAMTEAGLFDRSPAGLARSGLRILRLGIHAAGGLSRSGTPLHLGLARGWGLEEDGAALLRAALVLAADHELNPSTFAVRVVAGTGASLQACIAAGLAALSGPRHGGMTARVEALLDELGTAPAERGLARRLARGEELPGFGHRLYPDGDPRARLLLARLEAARPGPILAHAGEVSRAARLLTGLHPNIDFALVVLRRVLGLAEGAAFAIFAIGRMTGWIGHAMEQIGSGEMMRPRAAYAGPRPVRDREGG